jgi:hypothetical protein
MLLALPYGIQLANAERAPVITEHLAGGWLMPLLAPRLLSATQLAYFFGANPVSGSLLDTAGMLSMMVYGLVWCGIGIAVRRIGRAIRTGDWTPGAHIQSVLLAAFALQSLIDGVSGKAGHPQYENATWIAAVLFAWVAIDALSMARNWRRTVAPLATMMLALSLLVSVVAIASRLHRSRGTREVYGPTLGNQQQVARQLSRYSMKSQLSREVFPYDMYPDTLAVLRRLNPSPFQAPPGDLEIRYVSDDPANGAIELVNR